MRRYSPEGQSPGRIGNTELLVRRFGTRRFSRRLTLPRPHLYHYNDPQRPTNFSLEAPSRGSRPRARTADPRTVADEATVQIPMQRWCLLYLGGRPTIQGRPRTLAQTSCGGPQVAAGSPKHAPKEKLSFGITTLHRPHRRFHSSVVVSLLLHRRHRAAAASGSNTRRHRCGRPRPYSPPPSSSGSAENPRLSSHRQDP